MIALPQQGCPQVLVAGHVSSARDGAEYNRVASRLDSVAGLVRAGPCWKGSELTVSVVITCHNYGRYLRECLESVLAQDRQPDEILVVDDASTDDTPVIAASYASFGVRYERVEYRNPCHSYNHGIAATTGDLIAFVDADNVLLPHFIGTLAAALEADQQIGFAYSDRYWAGEADAGVWADLGVVPGTVYRSFPPDPAMLVHENFIDTMSMVRRMAVEAVGGYKDIPILWDYQLWIAIIESGWGASYLPEPLYRYRVHGSNMIVATRPQHRGCALLIRREHFQKPFWAPYTQPHFALDMAVLPAQQLPGGTPLHLYLTPKVVGEAYPAAIEIEVVLPDGVEYLAGECDWRAAKFAAAGQGVCVTIRYPVPDGAAAARTPTVRLTVVARRGDANPVIVTVRWADLYEHDHVVQGSLELPTLSVMPPLQLPLSPGGLQPVRGQFAPGEPVGAWAAMPANAPYHAVPLPTAEADGSGTVYADCRLAPQGFAAIVLQGELTGTQVVLVPESDGANPPTRLSALQRSTGARLVTSLRQRIGPRRWRSMSTYSS